MYITVAILAITVIFLIWGKIRSDIVTLYALLALTIFSVLTPQEALAGFSSNVIFVTAGMLVVSGAIVRSGLANVLSKKILSVGGKNAQILFMLIMFLTAMIGSLVSNTGTIAIMMPIVVSMALSIDESPSRFLMPLAFMSSIGGMFTLVGNSPNMVVNDAYIKAGFAPLKLFSFFPVGLACFLFGMIVLAPVSSYLLSRRKNDKAGFIDKGKSIQELLTKHNLAGNFFRVSVPAASPLIGQCLADLRLTESNHIVIQEISRREEVKGCFGFHKKDVQIIPNPRTAIKAGDILGVLGAKNNVLHLIDQYRLAMMGSGKVNKGEARLRFDSIGICELVIMSSSHLVNRPIADSRLREEFGITVLSIHRGDKYIFENLKDQAIKAGDALLVQGTWDNLARAENSYANWVVVGNTRDLAASGKLYQKIPLVAVVIVLMIAVMAFSLLPTVTTVLLAALVLVSGGCFRNMRDVYSSISWETLVVLASMFAVAAAMQKTGIVDAVAAQVLWVGTTYGAYAALAVVYAATSFMNVFISSTPVALLTSPIAVHVALALKLDPLPFIFAVATAASMCFASPFSTPSNTLVMSTGRYTFLDYLKIGLPMQIIMGAVMVLIIPLLFPFTSLAHSQ